MGTVAPIIILFILFLIKGLGAGDIKLISVVGAFTGMAVLKIMVYAFISGGILSVIYFIGFRKRKIHFSLAVFIGVLYYIAFGK